MPLSLSSLKYVCSASASAECLPPLFSPMWAAAIPMALPLNIDAPNDLSRLATLQSQRYGEYINELI